MIKFITKATKILAITMVVVIIVALGIIITEPFLYHDFFGKNSQKEFATPGISDDFVQQGFCVAKDDVMFVSGYMKGKKPSRIYIVDSNDKDAEPSYVQLKDTNGQYTTTHAGGISVYSDKVYVCKSEGNPATIQVYSLTEILSAKKGGDVVAKDEFAVKNNASFCHVENGNLYVGEFFMKNKFDTKDEHKVETPAGDKHSAMIYAYALKPDGTLVDSQPIGRISIPDKIQGMTFAGDKIVLSCSYSLLTSKFYVYDLNKASVPYIMPLAGRNIPTMYLDSSCLIDTIYAPPMAEEIVYHNGRLFALNESACNKYIFGKLLRAKYVWSIKI